MKLKLTAEEKKIVSEEMKRIGRSGDQLMIAKTIGDVYDVEMGVSPVIEAVARFERTGLRPDDNHIYYLTPTSVDKKVFVLTDNCNVTQVQVTPNSRAELVPVPVVTPDYWICLSDFLKGDHDALALAAESLNEAMDRYEIKGVLNLLEAGAVAEGNVFAPASGGDTLTYPVLVSMRKSIKKYGTEFVLIAGENVSEDIDLMDYVADTNREYALEKLNITHIPVLSWTVDIDGSGQEELIDPDTAYLVAVKDAKGNKPVLVARRAVAQLADMADTTAVAKDRIVIDTGNMKNIGATVKFARGKAGYEEVAMVLLNSKVVAKFTK